MINFSLIFYVKERSETKWFMSQVIHIPCLDTIDPIWQRIKCLINPRDTVTKYIIEIKPTRFSGFRKSFKCCIHYKR